MLGAAQGKEATAMGFSSLEGAKGVQTGDLDSPNLPGQEQDGGKAKWGLFKHPRRNQTRDGGGKDPSCPATARVINPPPLPPHLAQIFFFFQDFYCSVEMSRDISFSPSINIASTKCNYQGRSGTSVY